MPKTDNDKVSVIKATRSGANNIVIEFDWVDGFTSAPKGRFSVSWGTADELKPFLEEQTFEDVVRALLLQCLNRSDTGALRPTVFDDMPGKTFVIQQRVQEVV